MPAAIFSSVDLPEPLRPTRQVRSPGETVSYGALAARIGRPTAARAVARANGANQIAIVVPCHRVIGADGSITGYAGGLDRKRTLLALEEPSAGERDALF